MRLPNNPATKNPLKNSSGRSYRLATAKSSAKKSTSLHKKHKPSSQRWLTRQLNDPYVAEAKRLGYRSRAAFKLAEIDDAHRLFQHGQVVLDLGCAPGGWLQLVADRIGLEATPPTNTKANTPGQLIGVDLVAVDPIPHVHLIEGDMLADATQTAIHQALKDTGGSGKADWVLSDMAAATIGHRQTDHLRTDVLLEAAITLAKQVLRPGGGFLGKCFAGGSDKARLDELRASFSKTRHLKPAASRKQSAETYVLATGFRP